MNSTVIMSTVVHHHLPTCCCRSANDPLIITIGGASFAPAWSWKCSKMANTRSNVWIWVSGWTCQSSFGVTWETCSVLRFFFRVASIIHFITCHDFRTLIHSCTHSKRPFFFITLWLGRQEHVDSAQFSQSCALQGFSNIAPLFMSKVSQWEFWHTRDHQLHHGKGLLQPTWDSEGI